MKSLTAVLTAVLFVCAALATAQIPFRCKSPDTWEAHFYETRSGSSYSRTGMIFYDAPGQRIVIEEDSGSTETSAFYEYFFFKEKYALEYNIMTKQCNRIPLNATFSPIEVPTTAVFIERRVIGLVESDKFGLAVNVWGDNSGPNGRRILEFVADDGDGDEDCLPVSTAEFGGPSGMGARHQSYYDIVIGVNPDHFIPPEVCP